MLTLAKLKEAKAFLDSQPKVKNYIGYVHPSHTNTPAKLKAFKARARRLGIKLVDLTPTQKSN